MPRSLYMHKYYNAQPRKWRVKAPSQTSSSSTDSDSPNSDDTFSPPPSKSMRSVPFVQRQQPFQQCSRARSMNRNIFITTKDDVGRDQLSRTETLRRLIAGDVEDERMMYYYLDRSTTMQINDGQMRLFHLSDGRQVSLLHFDLRCKRSQRTFYGVVKPYRDRYSIRQERWLMEAFMDAADLAMHYGLTEQHLPLSSREKRGFQAQLTRPPRVKELGLAQTNWSSVRQIKNLWKSEPLRVPMHEWLRDIRDASTSISGSLPLFPVVSFSSSRKNRPEHWIEWVQMVRVARFGVFVGVSFKRSSQKAQGCDAWSVQSIDVNVSRIFKKHRLVALDKPLYTKHMRDVHAMRNERYPALGISGLAWTRSDEYHRVPPPSWSGAQPPATPNEQKEDKDKDTSKDKPVSMPMPTAMSMGMAMAAYANPFAMGMDGAEENLDMEWMKQMVDDVLENISK